MIKQPLTQERADRIYYSLQKLAILSQVLLLENQTELDVNFRVPHINQFASRIGKDCKTIQQHLESSGRIVVKSKDKEFLEEYSGEMWRVVTLLAGLDIELIKEFANNLEGEFKKIKAA